MTTNRSYFIVILILTAFLFLSILHPCKSPEPQPVPSYDLTAWHNYIDSVKVLIKTQQAQINSLKDNDTIIITKWRTIRDTIEVQTLPGLVAGTDSIYGITVLLNDSLVCFNTFQLRAIVLNYAEGKECDELLRNCNCKLEVFEYIANYQKAIIEQDSLTVIGIRDSLAACQGVAVEAQKQIVKERLWKRIGWGVAALFGVLAVAK